VSGHVFHHGHQQLHGVTVVVDAASHTYIGRYDRVEDGKLQLLNVAVHDAATAPREEFLRRSRTFGVRVDIKHLAIAEAEVSGITPLADLPA
jgi:hypothetical protein